MKKNPFSLRRERKSGESDLWAFWNSPTMLMIKECPKIRVSDDAWYTTHVKIAPH